MYIRYTRQVDGGKLKKSCASTLKPTGDNHVCKAFVPITSFGDPGIVAFEDRFREHAPVYHAMEAFEPTGRMDVAYVNDSIGIFEKVI